MWDNPLSDQNKDAPGSNAVQNSNQGGNKKPNAGRNRTPQTANTRPGGGKSGPNKKGGANKGGRPPIEVAVRPIAVKATMRKRHWGIAVSFVAFVLWPVLVTMFYLWVVAADQYSSHTGFTVRSEEKGGATDLLGGLASFTAGSANTDANVLYEFIQSQEIVEKIARGLICAASIQPIGPKIRSFRSGRMQASKICIGIGSAWCVFPMTGPTD